MEPIMGMDMKPVERIKVQKVLEKIQSGDYDEVVVDSLFTLLRPYCRGNRAFREIADFVAHNDARNCGLAIECVERCYLSHRYFTEYLSDGARVDLHQPFPSWIKRLLKYQIDSTGDELLRVEFKSSTERLKSKIDNLLDTDKRGNAFLRKGKISQDDHRMITWLLGRIIFKQAFTPSDFIDELMHVMKDNRLEFNEEAIRDQASMITLCLLVIMNKAELELVGKKRAECLVSTWEQDKTVPVPVSDDLLREALGTLHIGGKCPVSSKGKDFFIVLCIFRSELNAFDWCDRSLIRIEPDPYNPGMLVCSVDLDRHLMIKDGKLFPI